MLTSVPPMLKRVPRTAICAHTAPRAGSVNCGMKARMKMATFGLRRLTSTPSAHTRARLVLAAPASSSAVGLERSSLKASHARYAQPAHFRI
jgi:hypothetical protein